MANEANDPRVKNAKIIIRNNNIFYEPTLSNMLKNYPNFQLRTGLSADAIKMKNDGRFIEENNFSEVLTFDYAPPLPTAYWKLFLIKEVRLLWVMLVVCRLLLMKMVKKV